MRARIALFAVLAMVGVMVTGCSTSTGSTASATAPTISSAWVRPGAAGGGTAAYLQITGSSAADALVSASSPGADMLQLHETTTDNTGMTGMQPIPSLAVPAGGTVALKPGGYHLMIMGLKKALAVGDTLEIDLVFQNAGKVAVQAEVKPA